VPLAAASVAAVLAIVFVYRGRLPQSPVARVSVRQETAGQGPRIAEPPTGDEKATSRLAIPAVVVIEDAESYSFIDTTAGAPMVSFATKDSCSPLCVVPVLPELVSQAAEAEVFDKPQEPPLAEGRGGGRKSGPGGGAR
jgi:hypothetical protein